MSNEIINNFHSSLYCLPSNTAQSFNARINDDREGLIAFANDSINYGTLYMIDNNGKAIIPKASLAKLDTLFSGTAGVYETDFILSESIYRYSKLTVVAGTDNGTNGKTSIELVVDEILSENKGGYAIGSYLDNSTNFRIGFTFTSEKTFKLTSIVCAGWTNPVITQIYGTK